MGHSVFGGEKCTIEDLAGVAAGEMAGFRDRVEDLAFCSAVNGEVVDGFVSDRIVRYVWCLWEHAEYCFGVWSGERLPLKPGSKHHQEY